MTAVEVRAANAADRQALIDTLILAFGADPCARYAWPTPGAFLRGWPRMSMGMGGRGLDHGTAYVTEGGEAAALWLPPGVEPDSEAMGAVIGETVSAEKQAVLAEVVEQMGRFHPSEPHWYLAVVGVDPARTGLGLGSALIKHALRRCDEEGRIAYLESSNPRNLPLYERHGFEVMGVIQPGDFPPMHPMLRPARR